MQVSFLRPARLWNRKQNSIVRSEEKDYPLQDRKVTQVWRLQNRTNLVTIGLLKVFYWGRSWHWILVVGSAYNTRVNKKEGRRKGEGRTGIFVASFWFEPNLLCFCL